LGEVLKEKKFGGVRSEEGSIRREKGKSKSARAPKEGDHRNRADEIVEGGVWFGKERYV